MAATVAVVAALSLSVVPAHAQAPAPIDLTGPIERANCAPCHLRIAETDVAGLIFSHGNHLVFPCESCHRSAPHESGVTRRPGMDICFACHGMTHPDGLLATDECSACHPPGTKLRPKSHVAKWAESPHATVARADGVNGCMMCHASAADCDECHDEKRVRGSDNRRLGPMPAAYQSVVPEIVDRQSVIVDTGKPTTMGQCVFCHSDIDAMSAPMRARLIFSHEPHLKDNHRCAACHPDFGHGPQTIRRPDMLSCYRCHGLVHGTKGLVATEKCDACHPKGFELKPSDHTKAFEKGEHKKRADKEPVYCAQCHKSEACVVCHRGKKKLADGTTSKPVVPADHKKREWKTQHGPLFLGQKGSCASCHDSKSCQRCHKTVMPHPSDWLKGHALEAGVPKSDCNVCHADRRACQECHHDQTKRAELIEANCTPRPDGTGCHQHAEMSEKPPTKIKNKGFAEHAVHFKAAKQFGGPKERPYMCDDCHVGFGSVTVRGSTSAMPGGSLASAAHDVRLCYGCHGALDYRNVLIAQYAGAELCRRCHAELRI